MRKLALALGLGAALLASAPSLAQSQVQGNSDAAAPVVAALKRVYPRSSQRFVNCPGNNRYVEQGIDVVVCEFRVVKRRMTIRGTAGSSPRAGKKGRWRLHGFHPSRPLPQSWKRCSTARLGGPAQTPQSLLVSGVGCLNAFYIASGIGSEALNHSLRLPRRFTQSFYGYLTRGFVTNTFYCRGRVQVLQGSVNPYGHETARCRTRFGDRLVYVFDQGS